MSNTQYTGVQAALAALDLKYANQTNAAEAAVTASTNAIAQALAHAETAEDHKDATQVLRDAVQAIFDNAVSLGPQSDMSGLSDSTTANAVAFGFGNIYQWDDYTASFKMSNNSFVNEPLGTATRGTRKHFPPFYFWTLEADKFTLYDATKPTLEMFLVANRDGAQLWNWISFGADSSGTSADFKNGVLVIGSTGATASRAGLTVANFLTDKVRRLRDTGYVDLGTIAERNDGHADGADGSPGLPNNLVNSVALHLDPAAPYDRMGNRMPTIGVAHDSGATVIDYAETVTSSSDTTAAHHIDFDERGDLYWAGNNTVTRKASPAQWMTASFTAGGMNQIGSGDIPLAAPIGSAAIQSLSSEQADVIMGNANGLAIVRHNETDLSKGSVRKITADAAWNESGDVQGAWLCSTTAETVSGANIFTDGVFSSFADKAAAQTAGWTSNGTESASEIEWTVTAGELVITRGSGGVTGHPRYAVTGLTVGELYKFTLTSDTAVLSAVVGSFGLPQTVEADATAADPVYFTATATSGNLDIWTNVSTTLEVSEFSITPVLPDRTHNENHLDIVGTLTASPVATGAELVAYSGFSTTDYLSLPYDASFDIGTADFSVTGWASITALGGGQILFDRGGHPGLRVWSAGDLKDIRVFINNVGLTTPSSSYSNDEWLHIAVNRVGGEVSIYLNGKLSTSGTLSGTIGAGVPVILGQSAAMAGTLLSSWAFSKTALSTDQIKSAYEREKHWFEENAAITIGGSSSDVIHHDYDAKTDNLYVLTSAGESVFNHSTGVRTSFDATKAGNTLVSVKDEYYAEADGMTVNVSGPAIDLRVEAQRYDKVPPSLTPQEFVGDGSTTVFELPEGMKATQVFDEANFRIEGDGDDYEQDWTGYRNILTFAVAPANTNKITVHVEAI